MVHICLTDPEVAHILHMHIHITLRINKITTYTFVQASPPIILNVIFLKVPLYFCQIK